MTTTDSGSLKSPPIRSAKFTAEQNREYEIQTSLNNAHEEDRQFMYDMHKQNQHAEKLLTSFLSLIRQFDYLPKHVLATGFHNALRHIYSAKEKALKQKEYEQNLLNKIAQLCENSKGEDE